MKKLLLISALATFSATASAEGFDAKKLSVGAGYGFNYTGVLSLRADYDISSMVDNKPIKARVGYDRYSIDTGAGAWGYSWSYNIFYGGAYYDFNKDLKLDKKIHPFAGLGFGFGSASCSGQWCGWASSPTVGGFYYIGGIQYDVLPNVSAEANFNGWGGLSLGANYKF